MDPALSREEFDLASRYLNAAIAPPISTGVCVHCPRTSELHRHATGTTWLSCKAPMSNTESEDGCAGDIKVTARHGSHSSRERATRDSFALDTYCQATRRGL